MMDCDDDDDKVDDVDDDLDAGEDLVWQDEAGDDRDRAQCCGPASQDRGTIQVNTRL